MEKNSVKLVQRLQQISLATVVWASLASVTLAETFTDISGNPYQAEIEEVAEKAIVKGFPDNTFRPTEPVTREQAVSMIVDALNTLVTIDVNEQPTRSVRPFSDVDPSRWSYAKIRWAQWNIIRRGTPTGNFRPTNYITRSELVDFLRRSAEILQVKLGGSSLLKPTQEEVKFADVSGYDLQLTLQMSAYCRVASPLNEKGNKFAPDRPAHRDYTAAAILRTINCIQQANN